MARPIAPHLRLIEPAARKRPISGSDFRAPLSDGELFVQNPALLVFTDFDALLEAEIISLIVSARPKLIIDLRLVPRFDVGSINRKLMLSIFEKVGARYYDIGGLTKERSSAQLHLDAKLTGEVLKRAIFRPKKGPHGPVVLLTDEGQTRDDFILTLAEELDEFSDSGWDLMKVPENGRRGAHQSRNIIFISHATPDDNEFAGWLGTQLQLSGYQVWADFEKLVGGENFWDDIEDVIRNRASKVIIVASKLAQNRNGVLDEINLAVSLERSMGLDNFVVPLRVDNTSYADFRANIARKNIINFTDNWANGLSSLLKMLERDRVPREEAGSDGSIARSMFDRLSKSTGVVREPETLLLNWLEIGALPKSVNLYRLGGSSGKVSALSKTLRIPHVIHQDLAVSFALPHEMDLALSHQATVKRVASFLTDDFLDGRAPELPTVKRVEAKRHLSNILRQAWESLARDKELQPYTLASGTLAWFIRADAIPKNTVTFTDDNGQRRKKLLVGYSARRSVFWHFALELKVLTSNPLRFVVKSHVVFSEDGKTPLSSASRMHALRRGFCKTWWNDRWRDLALAFLAWLSEGKGHIELNVGADQPVLVDGTMLRATCPVRPMNSEPVPTQQEVDQVDDELVEDVELDDEELMALSNARSWPNSEVDSE